MSNAKRCDRCGRFYTFNSLYGKSDVARITLLNGHEHNKENYDLCQRCREELIEWLEGNKKDRITVVVHTMSDYDLRQAQENILTSLPRIPGILNMPRCIDIPGRFIDIPGVEIFFRCGNPERCLGGLRPDYYVSDSVIGLEFLHQSAEKCGGERLKDIDELRNKVIELVKEK